jgi:hypothetical protein
MGEAVRSWGLTPLARLPGNPSNAVAPQVEHLPSLGMERMILERASLSSACLILIAQCPSTTYAYGAYCHKIINLLKISQQARKIKVEETLPQEEFVATNPYLAV